MRLLLGLLVAGLAAHQADAAESPCAGTPAGTGVAAAVQDGRTLTLVDGREVRLAGIEAPANNAALQALVSGQTLRLERVADDRYGRLVAYVYSAAETQPVQFALLEAGQARVAARSTGKTCTDALLAAERAARTAGRGRWSDPNFAPLSSENLTMLAAARGHFALVEGQVLSVRESGATIYVNFGRRWTRDFAATIPKRESRAFASAGVDLKALQGRRVRVRGILEQRRGPIIDVTSASQIELID
ncbi:MAG: thermonuclease family protein [Pseudolabrys sp.]|jgi:endonuclease YncB( thermonuclease family)